MIRSTLPINQIRGVIEAVATNASQTVRLSNTDRTLPTGHGPEQLHLASHLHLEPSALSTRNTRVMSGSNMSIGQCTGAVALPRQMVVCMTVTDLRFGGVQIVHSFPSNRRPSPKRLAPYRR